MAIFNATGGVAMIPAGLYVRELAPITHSLTFEAVCGIGQPRRLDSQPTNVFGAPNSLTNPASLANNAVYDMVLMEQTAGLPLAATMAATMSHQRGTEQPL